MHICAAVWPGLLTDGNRATAGNPHDSGCAPAMSGLAAHEMCRWPHTAACDMFNASEVGNYLYQDAVTAYASGNSIPFTKLVNPAPRGRSIPSRRHLKIHCGPLFGLNGLIIAAHLFYRRKYVSCGELSLRISTNTYELLMDADLVRFAQAPRLKGPAQKAAPTDAAARLHWLNQQNVARWCALARSRVHEQQPGLQHGFGAPPGLTARMKPLMNLPATSGASASTSIPLSDRKARASSTS